MKYVADLITGLCIIAAIAILFTIPFSVPFSCFTPSAGFPI